MKKDFFLKHTATCSPRNEKNPIFPQNIIDKIKM